MNRKATAASSPSVEQIAFAVAESTYKTSLARTNAAFASLPTDISEDDYITACTRIGSETNHTQHVNDWHAAMEALVDWVKARIETDPDCAASLADSRSSVDYMFANWRKYRKLADQFIAVCMCLENKPIPASYTA